MSRPVQIVTALFLATIVGAWAWFNVAAAKDLETIRFGVRSNIDGWRFEPEPIGKQAQEILATTNLINGIFSAQDGRRVMVFAADWRADSSQAMSVVQHTPDICWVGAGWLPADMGQPDQIQLELSGRVVPFECRVFAPPGGAGRELVLWCTLVGGTFLQESGRWATEENANVSSRTRFDSAGRRLASNQFLKNVANRRTAIGEKQFVRLSVPVKGEWTSSLEELKAFVPVWLSVEVVESERPIQD